MAVVSESPQTLGEQLSGSREGGSSIREHHGRSGRARAEPRTPKVITDSLFKGVAHASAPSVGLEDCRLDIEIEFERRMIAQPTFAWTM
jgi:hypothetical protein